MRRFYFNLFLSLGLVFSGFSATQESFYHLSFDELLELQTEVATVFPTDELLVPSSVTKVTEEQWRMRGARVGIQPLVEFIPGVANYPTLGGTGLSVRGYTSDLSPARGHSLLIDGIPLTRYSVGTAIYSLSNMNLALFSKFEMIRGPGSALHGSDAFHSILGFSTWNPEEDGFEVSGAFGDPKQSGIDLRYSKSFTKKSRFSAVFAVDGQGNQNINYSSRRASLAPLGTLSRDEGFESGSALLRWKSELEKGLDLDLGLLFHQRETDEIPGVTRFFGGPDSGDSETDLGMGWVKLEKELQDERKLELKAFRSGSGLRFGFDMMGNNQFVNNRTDLRSGWSLRLKQPEGTRKIQWVIGAGMNWQRVNDAYFNIANTGITPEPYSGDSRKLKHLLFSTRTKIKEKNYLILGGRLDDYPSFGKQFTPRVGLIHKADENTAYKLLYGNAFRAPAVRELKALGAVTGNPNLQPEEVDTYELIYQKRQGKSHFNLTFFRSEWNHGIEVTGGSYANSGLHKSHGVELQWGREIAKNLDMNLSASHVKSRDEVRAQDQFAYPERIFDLEFHHRGKPLEWRLAFRSMGDWRDGSGLEPTTPAHPLGPYLRTDLTLKHEIEKDQEVFLYVKNLLDRDLAVPSVWDSGYGLPETGIGTRLGFRVRF